MNNIDYKEILDNLGFKLVDNGRYWQTSAIFRDGDNPSAIQIYKDTGVWRDYVEDAGYLPFKLLIERCVSDSESVLRKIYSGSTEFSIRNPKTELLDEEKTYPQSCLKRLLPNRKFFLERGIKEDVLDAYKCGYATTGPMYGRIVFPIIREDGRIHGFSGRYVKDGETTAKWLHNGKTRNWVYPLHVIDDVLEAIREKGFIILVESVGDSMALTNAGWRNHLVVFGLNISPRISGILSSLDCPIHLCLNNDVGGKYNRGMNNACKHIFNFSDQISFERLFLQQIPANDFGDMSPPHLNKFCEDLSSADHKASCELVRATTKSWIQALRKNKDRGDKALAASLKQFEKQYNFLYK